MRNAALLRALVGLLLSFAGPPLIAGAGSNYTGAVTLASAFIGLGALMAICVAVVVIAVRWEKLPLREIGLRRPTLQSLWWVLALAGFFIFVFGPLVPWFYAALGYGGFQEGVAKVAVYPTWYLCLAIIVVATIEAILYRGYAIQRIGALSGSYRVAGAISVMVAALAHVPMWGWVESLSFVVSGGIITAFYLWRRELNATILAHVLTDLVGVLMDPREIL